MHAQSSYEGSQADRRLGGYGGGGYGGGRGGYGGGGGYGGQGGYGERYLSS